MSTAKFEKLIALIINEDQERAEQLFHEIVVEKSREIYEGLLSEDMTTDFIDEISAEEEGMDDMMEDDEFIDDEEIDGDYDVDGGDYDSDEDYDDEGFGDEEVDLDIDMDSEESDEEVDGLEDRVVDLEDKLDELMAEFESIMDDGSESEEEVDVDMDVEDEMVDEGKKSRQEREGLKDLRKSKDDRRQAAKDFGKVDKVAEATEMKKVPVPHNPSEPSKSPVDFNSGQKGMASHPVDFDDGGDTQQPKGPAQPKNYATKGETTVKGAASWKNKIGGDTATGRGKGESAPKPVNKQPAGGDQRSPVPESRRATRKMIK